MLLESRAMGGPLDTVKVSAELKWDGRVRTPESTAKVAKYYRGKYLWDWDFRAWIWYADKTEKAGTPRLFG